MSARDTAADTSAVDILEDTNPADGSNELVRPSGIGATADVSQLPPPTPAPASATPSAKPLSLVERLKQTLQKHKMAEEEEATAAAEEPAAPAAAKKNSEYLGVKADRDRFVGGWSDVVKAFVKNDELTIYDCPVDLSGYDRKMLHQLAEQFNLGHKSHGVGPDRRLRLTKDKLFFEHGKLAPSDARISELKQWTNMRRDFNPTSAQYNEATVHAIESQKEYVPLGIEDEVKRSTASQRAAEDARQEEQRLRRMRVLNRIGCFDDTVDAERTRDPAAPSLPLLPPSRHQPHGGSSSSLPPSQQYASSLPPQQPQYYPPWGAPNVAPSSAAHAPPPTKRARVEAEPVRDEDLSGTDPMQAFLQSGLAPKSVKITRLSVREALGIKFTKDLLITGVSGVCQRCNVPTDMFVNEVNGHDVNTVKEFSESVQGLVTFTLTLWYLRKDGSTVEKLKPIAKKAEEALQAAVEGTTITTLQTCTLCESSVVLQGDRWTGTRSMPCESCEDITPHVIEEFDDVDEGGQE